MSIQNDLLERAADDKARVMASIFRKAFTKELLELAKSGDLLSIKITAKLRDELQLLAAQGDEVSKRIIYYVTCSEK